MARSEFEQRVVANASKYNGYQAGEPPIRCEIVQYEYQPRERCIRTLALVKYWVCDPQYLYYWTLKDESLWEKVVHPTIAAAYQREQERNPVEYPLDCEFGEGWISHMLGDSYIPLVKVFERSPGYDLSHPFVMYIDMFWENEGEEDSDGFSDGCGSEGHGYLMPPDDRVAWLDVLGYTDGRFKL